MQGSRVIGVTQKLLFKLVIFDHELFKSIPNLFFESGFFHMDLLYLCPLVIFFQHFLPRGILGTISQISHLSRHCVCVQDQLDMNLEMYISSTFHNSILCRYV